MRRLSGGAGKVCTTAAVLLLAVGFAGVVTVDARPNAASGSATPVTGMAAGPAPLCPVTLPNGNTPPLQRPSNSYYGNGKLWTGLQPTGITLVVPELVKPDGSLGVKFPWWLGTGIVGKLSITGRRLDAPAPPLRFTVPPGYAGHGSGAFVASTILFPTEGCWEVTGHAGSASLTFVTLVLRTPAQPVPGTPPPVP